MSEPARPHHDAAEPAPTERPAGERLIAPGAEAAPPQAVEPGPAAPAELEPPFISPGRIAQFMLVGLALFAVGWLLWRTRNALVPFAFGLVLAYVLMPLVDRLDHGIPRPLAIGLIYVNALILLGLGFLFVVPPLIDQAQRLADNVPSLDALQDTSNWFVQEYRRRIPESLQGPIDTAVGNALRAIQGNVATYAQRAGGFLVDQTLRLVGTLTFLIGFLIIPIWLFYILNDKEQGRRFVDSMLHRRVRPDFWNIWELVNKTFSAYIRGQLLLCLAVGMASGLGLLLLRLLGFEIPSILLLALIAGVTELVPIIGPVLGAIPAVLVALVSADNPGAAVLAVIVVYVIVQQLENNFLVPTIVGDSLGIHPAILIVLLVVMGEAFGLIGVILSAPLAAVSRDLFTYAYRRFGGAAPAAARAVAVSNKEAVDMNAVDEPEEAAREKAVGEG